MTASPGVRAGTGTSVRGRLSGDAAVAGAGLVALAVLVLLAQQPFSRGVPQLVLTMGMFGVFVAAARAAERLAEPACLRFAVLGGAALQVVALRVRPWTTDDHLRYAWDGRVQAAGIDPYRYVPGAPELAGLRDPWLFPDGTTPALNHPSVRTIYPPVAQAWFWLVHVLSGGRGQGLQLQIGAALLAAAVSLAVVVVLRWTGNDPRRVVWWAWCPAVVLEAGGNAHVDVLGVLFVVSALGLVGTRSWWAGGFLLGLAVATKFVPALVAVGVPPRRSLRVATAAAAAVAIVYLPHVAVLGTDVVGFLGGYLAEEQTDRYDLLRFLLPDVLAAPAGVLVLTATALRQWGSAGRREARGQPPQPWSDAAVLVGVSFLVVTPAYPWYALLIVGLVALGAPRIWLVVAAAVYPVYAAAALGDTYYATRVVSYGLAAVILLVTFIRARTRVDVSVR
ncbi:MAG: hypothetical protein HY830_10190 [Actinobacteria bacterium]|nr:hypothetical protein [Actinomycetota bacterium]